MAVIISKICTTFGPAFTQNFVEKPFRDILFKDNMSLSPKERKRVPSTSPFHLSPSLLSPFFPPLFPSFPSHSYSPLLSTPFPASFFLFLPFFFKTFFLRPLLVHRYVENNIDIFWN